MKEKYSNIKIVFLPPNTTSKLQPLDLGIIANFKTHYRRLLLRFVLASIDTCNSASVVRSVTSLTAIRWISKAWMEVKPETVSRCFRRAGILTEQLQVTSVLQVEGPDPFADVEAEMDIAGLISNVMGKCSSVVYVNGGMDYDDETWDQRFLEGILMTWKFMNLTPKKLISCHHLLKFNPIMKLCNHLQTFKHSLRVVHTQ